MTTQFWVHKMMNKSCMTLKPGYMYVTATLNTRKCLHYEVKCRLAEKSYNVAE